MSTKITLYSEWEYCGKCGVKINTPQESVVPAYFNQNHCSKQVKELIDMRENMKNSNQQIAELRAIKNELMRKKDLEGKQKMDIKMKKKERKPSFLHYFQ